MAICPATYHACIDDLCYGSGCLKMQGAEPMLNPCPGGCGALVGIDGSDPDDACECFFEDDEDMEAHS
jgi:hypothetical protein